MTLVSDISLFKVLSSRTNRKQLIMPGNFITLTFSETVNYVADLRPYSKIISTLNPEYPHCAISMIQSSSNIR